MRCVSCAPRFGSLVDRLCQIGELRVAGDAVRQQLDHAEDDGQDVVEVVSDAAGELADRLHLLRLAQLLLQPHAARSCRGR